jgi:hypothetical protein
MTAPDPLVGVRNHTSHPLSLVEDVWRRLLDFKQRQGHALLQLLASVQHPATDVPMWAAQAILNAKFAEGWDPASGQLRIRDDLRSIIGSSINHDGEPGELIYPELPGSSHRQQPPSGRAFMWDWKAQPPMKEIGEYVTQLAAEGPVYFIELDTGSDCYEWVISNQELTQAEAQEVSDASTIAMEDL